MNPEFSNVIYLENKKQRDCCCQYHREKGHSPWRWQRHEIVMITDDQKEERYRAFLKSIRQEG